MSAVQTAFLHNHLIFAFKETQHNSKYVAAEHVFAAADVEKMIVCLKETMADEGVLKARIARQHEWAVLEDADAYLVI